MTTTNEIAEKIASEQNLTKAQAKTIVETVFASITTAASVCSTRTAARASQAPILRSIWR